MADQTTPSVASLQNLIAGQQQTISAITQAANALKSLKTVTWVSTPATATSTGTPGQISYDLNYFYVCVAPNSWCRVGIVSW